jgi:hypothetical protein
MVIDQPPDSVFGAARNHEVFDRVRAMTYWAGLVARPRAGRHSSDAIK